MLTNKMSPHKALNILVIDDEDTVVKLFTKLLESEGHTVTAASNGADALLRLNQGNMELIFLDLKLPDIDGTKLLEKMKEKIEWTPVVIVTANPSLDSSIQLIRTGGVYEYIIKPFELQDLKLAIRRVMEKLELKIQNRRLLKKLERTNQALSVRVDELEKFAKVAVDYEDHISGLKSKIAELEKKIKKK